jgi:endonuclease YncB( thermonuclease family)
MSKIFVNENPQGPAPPLAPAAPQPAGDAAQVVANVLMTLFGLAIAGGIALLLYHYWKVALAFLFAMVLFACGFSRTALIGFLCVVAVVLAVLGQSAKAQTVVDGDTIKLNGTTYRIWGIDAAETKQACADGWMAGQEASKAMLELVSGRKVTCEARITDRYGRTVVLCRSDGRDVGAAMVSAGMAWAFTRYSPDYVQQERAAIGASPGVHQHDCEKPWDWRTRNRTAGVGRP